MCHSFSQKKDKQKAQEDAGKTTERSWDDYLSQKICKLFGKYVNFQGHKHVFILKALFEDY